MTALSANSRTTSREGILNPYPVKTNATIYQGSLVMMTSGKAAPAAKQAGAIVVGVADSPPWDGKVSVKTGTFLLQNSSGSDKITTTEVGKIVYAADDATVAKTEDTSRPPAGIVVAVRDGGVWVEVGPVIGGLSSAIGVNAAEIETKADS